MDEKTMLEIAEKIKNETATEEEIITFKEEYAKLLEGINNDLKS